MPIEIDDFDFQGDAQKQEALEKPVPLRKKNMQICKFCSHPQKQDLEAMIVNGVKTQKEVSEQYSMATRVVSNHMNYHFKSAVTLAVGKLHEELAKAVIDKIGMMRQNLILLNTRLDQMLGQPHDEVSIKDIKTLASEVRGWIMDLARLEGEYKDAPTVYVQNIKNQFVEFQSFMIEKLCNSCKEKFINEFPDVIDIKPGEVKVIEN
jgi:hypothetical protein